jgi:hypothetical protein
MRKERSKEGLILGMLWSRQVGFGAVRKNKFLLAE